MVSHRAAPVPEIRALPASAGRSWLLFALGFSLLLSAQAWARITVAGMLFQPVLAVVVALFLAVGPDALTRVPRGVRGWMTAYAALMSLAVIVGGNIALEPVAKLASLWLVVMVVGAAIERDEDAWAAGLGFASGMALLSVQTLVLGDQLAGGGGTGRGYNPFEGVANENAFSLYALPALLIAGAFVVDQRCPKWMRGIFALSSAAIAIGVLSTPNRSGYLGLVLIIVLLLVRGRRLRDTLIIVTLGALLYGGFTVYGDSAGIDYEFSERKDAQSDWEKRIDIVGRSVDVGLNNPVLGVGLQNVPSAIGESMYAEGLIAFPKKDAHNLLGEVVAGGGLLGLTALLGCGSALWSRPREWRELGPATETERNARGLLRIMVVLLLTRGLFTGAVLTTPGFALGLGLCLGMTVAARPRSTSEVSPAADQDRRAEPRGVAWDSGNRRRLVEFDPWARR